MVARALLDQAPRMGESARRLGWTAVILAVAGCAPTPQESTGGVCTAAGPLGRGLAVIDTDFQSTNVSLIGLDGEVLSTSFISTADSKMSWDVQAPSMASTGDDIVLLDRTFGIVTWVNACTAEIREQFHADGDELARNPWDYLPISPEKAYVTRYDRWPGNSDHGDVIVLDPRASSITAPVGKRIAIAPSVELPGPGYSVHPARGVVAGDRAYVTTVNATLDYTYAASSLVVIDTETDAIVAVRELTGLHDCTGIALSPSGAELAISCSGDLEANGDPSLGTAGVVLLSREDLSENKRYSAVDLGGGVPGFSLSYAAERSLVVTLLGNVKNDLDDVAIAIDLDSGAPRVLHSAGPVQLGAFLCPARLDDASSGRDPEACFLTDADTFSVVRFPVASGALGAPLTIDVDEGRGRPPRYLGQF